MSDEELLNAALTTLRQVQETSHQMIATMSQAFSLIVEMLDDDCPEDARRVADEISGNLQLLLLKVTE